jgi:thiol-disulfide isomerase/thioredoxin
MDATAAQPVPAEVLGAAGDAPAYFREALDRARAAGKPVLIDFWAPWCAPCMRLKQETLDSPELAALLDKFEVIAVDLDEEPALGRFYRVSSIPSVLIVDPKGNVVDRLLGFEPPALFEVRLKKALP